MRNTCNNLLTLLIAFACTSVVRAADPSTPGSAAASYPQWRNDGSGSAPETGKTLIDDVKDVDLVWTNDVELPPMYHQYLHGGYGCVAVADGRVFVPYIERSGDFVEERVLAAAQKIWGGNIDRKDFDPRCVDPLNYRVDADDVVLCVDAKTGKTLWKKAMVGKGVNTFLMSTLMHTQPAIKDGRVYVHGSLGRVYCLDASNGELVWESTNGAGFAYISKVLADWKADPERFSDEHYKGRPRGTWMSNQMFDKKYYVGSPQIAGDVLVVGDAIGGMAGLSLATGEQVWHQDRIIGKQPIAWRHGDRHFVLTGNACYDAKTGEQVWTFEPSGGSRYMGPTVAGDILMTHGALSRFEGKSRGFSGYRISPTGAEQIWEVDPAVCPIGGNAIGYWAPVAHRGHIYVLSSGGGHGPKSTEGYICIDITDGTVKGVLSGGGEGASSLVACDGLIITLNLGGWRVIKAAPEDFRYLAYGDNNAKKATERTFPTLTSDKVYYPDGTSAEHQIKDQNGRWATSCFVGGRFYYRGSDRLYCYDFVKEK